ncbi:PDZ/DHR/GLGF domain protein [Dictyocaulus viviparus]|uniref:PDZ/DHR/GLGF domain protein n=1 Tax=Dictyocaulus viviparus TaxID=29172 RepID=A0A0D8YBZ9_DICVI|nr:PDZ/DHR/GLGF domain protein [Dictyocaulus viviparus]
MPRSVSIDMPELNPTRKKSNPLVNGYANQCYDQAESICDNVESNNNQAIPLNEVIISVDRITQHLSKLEGKEEDSKILRDYFHSPPVQAAIEAVAVQKKKAEQNKKIDTESSLRGSGASDVPTVTSSPGVHVVSLFKREESYLGATVRNEENRIVIGRVIKGGIVEKTGLLKEGDELLELNGVDLRGKHVTEVCELLVGPFALRNFTRNISGDVEFVVSSPIEVTKKVTPTSSEIKHLRALFDYDPEDDIYVPCKELAIKFQRGDILHVLNTEDENWWQAYREGDDISHSLAGLIPSSSFHQQVMMYMDEMEADSKPKCRADAKKRLQEAIRALGRKSFKEVQRSADEPTVSNIDCYSALTAVRQEVFNRLNLLTYEEVTLYLSRTDRKRPLVLCGPDGVGCLELRQRLLESDRDRLAGPVPYTTRPARDGEIDGIHYHFVTKQRFLEDSKVGKFVEYGEYERYMYGTAVADIVNVIRKSKICVLTLKPESLVAVRTNEIMPFILFIAPPSLHTLRRQKDCAGQFHVKDDELKSILTQGKRIEQKFGHLFDGIIVNTDFDKSLAEMKTILRRLETEPHWVPISWTLSGRYMDLRFLFFVQLFDLCISAIYDGNQYYEVNDEMRADCILQEDMAFYIYLGFIEGDRNYDIKGESCLIWREVYERVLRNLDRTSINKENFQLNMTKPEEVMLHNKCRRVELSSKHPSLSQRTIEGPWCYVRKKDNIVAEKCFDICKGEPREDEVLSEGTQYGEQKIQDNYNDVLIENIRKYYTSYSWGDTSYYRWVRSHQIQRIQRNFFEFEKKREAAASRRRREQAIKMNMVRVKYHHRNTTFHELLKRKKILVFFYSSPRFCNTTAKPLSFHMCQSIAMHFIVLVVGLLLTEGLTDDTSSFPIPPPIGPQKYSNGPFCTTPQTVHDCYVTYLDKYGIHSGPYYLASYDRLDQQLKALPLTNICRDFEELTSCLRLVSYDCISIPVFERFTSWYGKVNEDAVAYVQNHAFLEFACGIGKAAFMANHDCLSRAFNVQSLTQRINNCLPTESDLCTKGIRAVQCVKESLTVQCSASAGSAACGAATNIAQRAKEVSPMCIHEMNLICSSSTSYRMWITSIVVITIIIFFTHCSP